MSRTLRLLLVEDNPGDARLVREALADVRVPAQISHVSSLGDALKSHEEDLDAILLDLGLPDSSGVATVVAMREHAAHTPIVVLSGLNDDAAGLEAVRLGAQDYLVKGEVDGRVITRALRYAIERKHAEDRLLATKEALESANQSLDEFVSIASHDLRDPLAKILALSSVLSTDASGPLADEDRGCVEEIGRSARRMQRLIDALLSYARTVRRIPSLEPLPLNRVVDEVLDDLAFRVREQSAVIDVEDLPTVVADPVQIRQVLQNLVANALKFSAPDRPLRIRIGARTRHGIARIAVSDNGIGFAPADAAKLFRPFAQLGGQRDGSGLGLAICRRIIEAHGGEISASAVPDRGATFTFTLPVLVSHSADTVAGGSS